MGATVTLCFAELLLLQKCDIQYNQTQNKRHQKIKQFPYDGSNTLCRLHQGMGVSNYRQELNQDGVAMQRKGEKKTLMKTFNH